MAYGVPGWPDRQVDLEGRGLDDVEQAALGMLGFALDHLALTVWPGKAFWTNTTNGPFSVSTRDALATEGHVCDGQLEHLALVKRSFDATMSSHAAKVQGE